MKIRDLTKRLEALPETYEIDPQKRYVMCCDPTRISRAAVEEMFSAWPKDSVSPIVIWELPGSKA